MKRKVLGVLFTAMCLCAVPSAAYAEAQEAETTEAVSYTHLMRQQMTRQKRRVC